MMNQKLSEILKCENFRLVAGKAEGIDVNGIYICDLLSWVMGRAQEGSAWITIMGHMNIIAVAALTGVSCVIVAEGAEIDDNTVSKANVEGIPLITTSMPAFEASRKLLEMSET